MRASLHTKIVLFFFISLHIEKYSHKFFLSTSHHLFDHFRPTQHILAGFHYASMSAIIMAANKNYIHACKKCLSIPNRINNYGLANDEILFTKKKITTFPFMALASKSHYPFFPYTLLFFLNFLW